MTEITVYAVDDPSIDAKKIRIIIPAVVWSEATKTSIFEQICKRLAVLMGVEA